MIRPTPDQVIDELADRVKELEEESALRLAVIKSLVEDCKWYSEDPYDREPPHMCGGYQWALSVIEVANATL